MQLDGELGTILVGANLSNANLSGCRLYFANLDGADLTDADMSGIDMTDACIVTNSGDLDDYLDQEIRTVPVDLRNSNLRGANLVGARLYCNFEGTIMPNGTEFRPSLPQ
jgi:uncharacterized protein YjbI with pentapeptide repeats